MAELTPDLKSVIAHLNAKEAEEAALSSKAKRARTVARMVLVQALYQLEITGAGVESVVREFSDFRFDGDLDGEPLAEADEEFFAEGARAIVAKQAEIDPLIINRLAHGWRLERLDTILRAILRAGAWELKFRPDIGTEIVIDEYVEISRAFLNETDAKFVNAALDGMATDSRA